MQIKTFIIDNEEIQYDKNDGWTLIGIPKEPDGYLTDHEYFYNNVDIFDRIQSTHQKRILY